MPCQDHESEDAALPPSGFTTPTKANCNDGAGHCGSDAKETKSELDADVEEEFDELTCKKRKGSAYLKYTEIKRRSTRKDSMLEPAQISHEIYTLMKKFMQQSRLMKAQGHRELPTDLGLWKRRHRKEYSNSRTDELEWIRVMTCPMKYRCKCRVQVRSIAGKDYKRLEFLGTYDENSHSTDHSKTLSMI